MPDYLLEFLIANLAAIIGGVIYMARAHTLLEGRVVHIEKAFEEHLREKSHIMAELAHRMERMEHKIDTIAVRCAAYNHHKPPPWGQDQGNAGE